MAKYKPHYACFNCRKTFKRKLMWDIKRDNKDVTEAKCPQCVDLMANMGLDFESPKKDNIKEWNHIKELYSVGITFHSCGCSGPGYIPKDKDRLIAYFNEIKNDYTTNGLVQLQKSNVLVGVHSNQASVIIDASDVDDENYAFWRITEAHSLVVNINPVRSKAEPSQFAV